jgi:hypothetical protein
LRSRGAVESPRLDSIALRGKRNACAIMLRITKACSLLGQYRGVYIIHAAFVNLDVKRMTE